MSLVIFILFDLIPTIGGNQALNPSSMLFRIPLSMALAQLLRWSERREEPR
jgi:hypothetical protein